MITEEIKQKLVETTVNYFLEHKDKMSYELIQGLFKGHLYETEENTAALLLAGTVLTHNIPVPNQELKKLEIREIKDCYGGFITFWKSNTQETLIVRRSKEGTYIDILTGQPMTPLIFYNNNYEYLVSGPGENAPDLIDPATGITYEVKSNYLKKKSVSSLHSANRLIDCDGTQLRYYYICNTPSGDILDTRVALGQVTKFFTEEELSYTHAINNELLELIKSGELIEVVESKLEGVADFHWHPDNPQ